jgi:hypothetical protein
MTTVVGLGNTFSSAHVGNERYVDRHLTLERIIVYIHHNHVRNVTMRVMRKPYKTPNCVSNDSKSLTKKGLGANRCGVLSGSKPRKWVYLETI